MHRRSITYGFERRQSAQALVEFALILPLMLILVLGSLDIGRALVYGVAAQDGAREAARLGASSAIDSAMANPDQAVRQRLIDASRPALDGCDAVTAWGISQACGWTFTIDLAPATVVTPPYSSIAAIRQVDQANSALAIPFCKPAGEAFTDPNDHVCQFPGAQLKVTAIGHVSMWAGLTTPWGWQLPQITAQGQAVLMVLS